MHCYRLHISIWQLIHHNKTSNCHVLDCLTQSFVFDLFNLMVSTTYQSLETGKVLGLNYTFMHRGHKEAQAILNYAIYAFNVITIFCLVASKYFAACTDDVQLML